MMPGNKKIRGLRYECGCVVWIKDNLENTKIPFTCPEHGSAVKQTFEGYPEGKKEGGGE